MAQFRSKRFDRLLIAGLGLLVIVVGFVILTNNLPELKLGGHTFRYEVADTPTEQQQGLSDRENLQADHAMLFVFPTVQQNCFWMKDMHFPLDIIWLNDQKQVVYIKQNATPDSYPEQFCPNQLARYVVEVNAGMVQNIDVKLGDQAEF